MPCLGPDPRPEDYTGPLREEIAKLQSRVNWLTAALCLMTHPKVTSVATSHFDKYLSAIDPVLWTESGIAKSALLQWKSEHTKEDIKRRALEKLTQEEREALGHG